MKASWMRAWMAFSRSTSSGRSGRNGSRRDLSSPAVWTRRSTPSFSSACVKPNPAEMTPIEPVIELSSTQTSVGGAGEPVAPDAATSSTKAWTGSSVSSASRRIAPPMSDDCTGEPPGELMRSATAFTPRPLKARASSGDTPS